MFGVLGGFSIEQFGQLMFRQLHEQQTNENHKRKACFHLIAKLGTTLYTCISYIIITKRHMIYYNIIIYIHILYGIQVRKSLHNWFRLWTLPSLTLFWVFEQARNCMIAAPSPPPSSGPLPWMGYPSSVRSRAKRMQLDAPPSTSPESWHWPKLKHHHRTPSERTTVLKKCFTCIWDLRI